MTPARLECARILLSGGVSARAVAHYAWEPWGYASRASLEVVLCRLRQVGKLPPERDVIVPDFNRQQGVKLIRAVGDRAVVSSLESVRPASDIVSAA